MKKSVLIASAILFLCSVLDAKVTLPSVLSDNMVLQQDTEVALWGKAAPGRKVTIKVGWSKGKTVVTADPETGKWLARVATPKASPEAPAYDITISDGEALTLHDVLIGEVWFCSGQSNMEMPLKGYDSQPAKGSTAFILRAGESRPLRICNIVRRSSITPLEESEGSWKLHSPESAANTSATAYYFAEALQAAIGIPMGIIVSSWGGSSIETWMSREVIEKEFPEYNIDYLDGKSEVTHKYHNPCLLYNGQVNPIVPYTIKGMIWYQGETNLHHPDKYIRLQEAYVRMMRTLFNVPDAPFYFVQIAPYPYGKPNGWERGYFVEGQQKSLAVIPHSGMAVTCDVGEYGTIHPCNKEAVGQRLALLALSHDYGKGVIAADAPTYKSMVVEDGKILVKFNVDGLNLNPMGADIAGFEIAGEDKEFHKAKARLSDKDHSVIVVSSPDVPQPVAVRYCFRNWCNGGLYNNFGIPAASFRTDDWAL